MARPELGTKRVCPTTGRKFYDLNRDPIVSPYTGEVLARSVFEAPSSTPRASAEDADEQQDDTDAAANGPETVSLEDAAAEQEGSGGSDDVENSDDDDGVSTDDDTFLEEEEEGGDVSDLIDGDIEEEEES